MRQPQQKIHSDVRISFAAAYESLWQEVKKEKQS